MKKIRGMILIVCGLIMFVSGYMMFQRSIELRREQAAYAKLSEQMSEAEPSTESETYSEPAEVETEAAETEPEETEPAFEAPQALLDAMELYPDMIGWLTIEDTKVDYPIMQNADNEYYLHRNFMGEEAVAGAIYMDANHDIGAKGLHAIYGHHMKNGSMFKDVSKFVDTSYMEQHQKITIMTSQKELHLKPVYCYAAKSDGTYRQVLTSRGQIVQFILDHTGLEINTDDLYVLITCSYGSADERTYLYCVPEEVG